MLKHFDLEVAQYLPSFPPLSQLLLLGIGGVSASECFHTNFGPMNGLLCHVQTEEFDMTGSLFFLNS